MKVRFYLHQAGQNGLAPVRLYLLQGKRQTKITLPIRVRPQHWSKRRQRLRPSAPGSVEINASLDNLETTCQLMALEGADIYAIREKILQRLGRTQIQGTIAEHFDRFLAIKFSKCSQNSRKKWGTLRGHLHAFLNPDASLARITPSFLEEFQAYLLKQGMQNVTVNKQVANLKHFLRWLKKEGLIEAVPEVAPLPAPRKEVVYLTPEELNRFARVDLSDLPPGYEHARFIFLMACYTGLRISDLKQAMRPEAWKQINLEAEHWPLYEEKTKAYRLIPLIGPVRALLKSRRGQPSPIPKLSEQKANRYIKEIARRAGIDAPVQQQILQGGEREQRILPKWQTLTLHTGRRTFITIALHHGVEDVALLGLTHDDMRSLRSYRGRLPDVQRKRKIERAFRQAGL